MTSSSHPTRPHRAPSPAAGSILHVAETILLAAALAASALSPAAIAQTPAAPASASTLAFDTVSIHPDPASPSTVHDEVAVTPNGWRMVHAPLISALLTAFVPTTPDAMMYTVSTLAGVPDWMRTEPFTIEARVPASLLADWQNPTLQPAMLRSMMQTMLADRCRLAVHRGSREVAVYSLVVGKKGSKLKPAVPTDPHPGASHLPSGGDFLPNDGAGNAAFYNAPLAALTVVLSNFGGRPVEDHTGLTGRYDISFRRPRPGGPSLEPDTTPNPPPTIFEVAESLGLKLEPARTAVETLTVDHVEKPSEN